MIIRHSKRGFISIFWITMIMLVTTTIMVTATNMFSTFATISPELMSTPFQDYYNAEFGISYGNFLLVQNSDSNITGMAKNGSHPFNVPGNIIGTPVHIIITRLHDNGAPRLYTITSSANSANNKTTTATWDNGILKMVN